MNKLTDSLNATLNTLNASTHSLNDTIYSPRKSPMPGTPMKSPLSDRFIAARDSTAPLNNYDSTSTLFFKENPCSPTSASSGVASPMSSPPRRSAASPPGSPGSRRNNPIHNPSSNNGSGAGVSAAVVTGGGEPYSATLSRILFPTPMPSVLGIHSPNRLSAASAPDSESDRFMKSQGVVYSENRSRNFQSKTFRVIPQTPERILDAPELLDDFYLNLLDWSSRNVLTVALSHTCYLWNADNGSITQLMSNAVRENIITAVAWHPEGKVLAVGTNNGEVQLWDSETQQLLRSVREHNARVCSLAWSGDILASGSRDTTIRLHDLHDPTFRSVLQGHTQEVCGLRWSPNGTQLASGGNDNILNIWDVRRSTLDASLVWQLPDHVAAIKALAWNPKQPHLLVSGGGTADKTLRFWDTNTGECLHVVDTESQVCGVLWNHDGTELITSHGYSDNQLTIWKYPSLKRVADLTGHTSRVLYLAMSPDGQLVVSAAGDETIRFWRCFSGPEDQNSAHHHGMSTNQHPGKSQHTTTETHVGSSSNGGGAGLLSSPFDFYSGMDGFLR